MVLLVYVLTAVSEHYLISSAWSVLEIIVSGLLWGSETKSDNYQIFLSQVIELLQAESPEAHVEENAYSGIIMMPND